MLFHEPHLTVFKNSLSEGLSPDDLGGKPWLTFCKELKDTGVDAESFTPSDEKGKISRTEVLKLAASDVSTATVCAAVLAWGGMYMTHHEDLFRDHPEWLDVAKHIRNGKITRLQAYEEFRILRSQGRLKGLGPAFFTKLIYFLTRSDEEGAEQGFIMDQWAACSVNLLVGKPVVHLNCYMVPGKDKVPPKYSFSVSDLNTGARYEEFCVAMDALVALDPEYTPELIDRALIGNGGRKAKVSSWRDHVTRSRAP